MLLSAPVHNARRGTPLPGALQFYTLRLTVYLSRHLLAYLLIGMVHASTCNLPSGRLVFGRNGAGLSGSSEFLKDSCVVFKYARLCVTEAMLGHKANSRRCRATPDRLLNLVELAPCFVGCNVLAILANPAKFFGMLF